jgi:Spy/CpxP family protein refolding chaperone
MSCAGSGEIVSSLRDLPRGRSLPVLLSLSTGEAAMIRIRQHACIAGLVVLALTTSSYAQNQQRGRGFGGGFGGFALTETALLNAEKVQKELKITDEQKEKITAALREARPGGRDAFGGQNASQEERRKAVEEFQKKAAEAGKKAKETLTAEQSKRLREIYLQVAGTEALNNEEVAAALKISDDQKKQLATASEENRAKMRDAFQAGGQGGNREEAARKIAELRTEADAKILAILTADQKKQLDEMKGANANITRADLFQGGPGRRPGGNNN